jgi:hypothetical protein
MSELSGATGGLLEGNVTPIADDKSHCDGITFPDFEARNV